MVVHWRCDYLINRERSVKRFDPNIPVSHDYIRSWQIKFRFGGLSLSHENEIEDDLLFPICRNALIQRLRVDADLCRQSSLFLDTDSLARDISPPDDPFVDPSIDRTFLPSSQLISPAIVVFRTNCSPIEIAVSIEK